MLWVVSHKTQLLLGLFTSIPQSSLRYRLHIRSIHALRALRHQVDSVHRCGPGHGRQQLMLGEIWAQRWTICGAALPKMSRRCTKQFSACYPSQASSSYPLLASDTSIMLSCLLHNGSNVVELQRDQFYPGLLCTAMQSKCGYSRQ